MSSQTTSRQALNCWWFGPEWHQPHDEEEIGQQDPQRARDAQQSWDNDRKEKGGEEEECPKERGEEEEGSWGTEEEGGAGEEKERGIGL